MDKIYEILNSLPADCSEESLEISLEKCREAHKLLQAERDSKNISEERYNRFMTRLELFYQAADVLLDVKFNLEEMRKEAAQAEKRKQAAKIISLKLFNPRLIAKKIWGRSSERLT